MKFVIAVSLAMASPRLIVVRGNNGIYMVNGPPSFEEYNAFNKDSSKQVRALVFSKDGTVLAYSNGNVVRVISVPSCDVLSELDCPKACSLHFSPLATVLATWEQYIGNKEAQLSCNLHLWDVKTGKLLKSLHQRKQARWEPQWSDDESIVARNVNNEVHFYEKNDFNTIVKKIHLQKVTECSMSRGPSPHHVCCYVSGTKGQPAVVKLYKYPNFEGNSAVIASKTFFRADKIDMKWNHSGTAVLIQTSTDADKSGASYYGEQQLHLILTNGDSSAVQLAKNGPVYSFEWNPALPEFCVVYGFMPAKATLYDFKGDPKFDFGTNPRNLVFYNIFGNMLILAGFGNLNGHIEIWDLINKKEITRFHARDTTHLDWCDDGEYFVTATLSPRLRVGNGFKVWHYTGSLIHELQSDSGTELWEVCWRPFPRGTFPERKIIYTPIPGISAAKPEASKEVYRPPGARGMPSTFNLHDDFELPSNVKKTDPSSMSKAALKNKKKRDAKKNKKETPGVDVPVPSELTAPSEPRKVVQAPSSTVSDPEAEKKLKNLYKKLEQITKLKELQASGKQLELNQLEKISKETALLEEIEQLEL